MEVKFNKLSSNQIEIEIEIPTSQVEIYFQSAASEISKDIKVNGFRPGKVPLEIVEREIGSQKLYDKAANLAVFKTFPKAIIDLPACLSADMASEAGNKIEMVGQPDIVVTQIARGNPMKYKAKIWIIPEVKLANYKGLEVKKQKIKVELKEIDESLKYLQGSRTKLITVNRPAKKGDRVEIDFITRSNGVKIEGGESRNHPLIIGENRFIPGFEEKLEGMKVGQEKNFSLRVPGDWGKNLFRSKASLVRGLANKILDFEVKMNLVQERQVPELSDEFAKSLGNFQSLEHLKKSIGEDILKEKELKEKERIRMELIEKVAKNSEMDIPEALINIESDKMINELRTSIESMDLGFDRYLQEIKKTTEDLKKEWRENAIKRVRIALALREIAKKERIEVGEEEIVEEINKILKHYLDIEKAKKNIDFEALKKYTKGVIRNEKVFELLEKEAKIS